MWTIAAAVGAALPGAACVIPPELEPETADAGPSSPPIIVEASPSDLGFPGPLVLVRPELRSVSLTLRDNDLADFLYVKLFVDYSEQVPTPAWNECRAEPGAGAERIAICPLTSICTPIAAADANPHVLQAMVVDRAWLDDADPAAEGQPRYRAVTDPRRAGSSVRDWSFRCAVVEQ